MTGFSIAVALIFFSGGQALIVSERWKARVAIAGLLLGGGWLAKVGFRVLQTGESFYWAPSADLLPWIVMDGLSAFFVMVIAIMVPVGGLYSLGYMRSYLHQKRALGMHFFAFNLLFLSMIGVVTLQHVLAFLVSWELMFVSSLLLVCFENEKPEVVQAGMHYFIAMHVGFVLLVFGFSLLIKFSDSFFFEDFKKIAAQEVSIRSLIFFLMAIGFGFKAGFIPLHTWLPHAHPSAPSHVSGIMSGVMIKTGIYGILRTLTWLGTPELSWGTVLLGISLTSAIGGVFYALAQHDLKRLLAYHSIENIGIIGMGIGMGMIGWNQGNSLVAALGFSGALLHVLNHSIFKGLLFYGAGAVYQATHTRNIEQQGGLSKRMPKTACLFLIGALAICGLPPFNGFVSEFLIYSGMVQAFSKQYSLYANLWISLNIAGLALVGGLALACFTKAHGVVFLGKPRSDSAAQAKECSPVMWITMGILAGLTLLIGVFPQIVVRGLRGSLTTLLPSFEGDLLNLSLSQVEPLTQSMLGLIALVLCLWGVRRLFLFSPEKAKRTNQQHQPIPTWNCGYPLDSPRLQYTASSFAEPLLILNRFLLHIKIHQHLPVGVFPSEANFKSHSSDWTEDRILLPFWKKFHGVMIAFAKTQMGSTNVYLLYGLGYIGLIVILSLIGVLD